MKISIKKKFQEDLKGVKVVKEALIVRLDESNKLCVSI